MSFVHVKDMLSKDLMRLKDIMNSIQICSSNHCLKLWCLNFSQGVIPSYYLLDYLEAEIIWLVDNKELVYYCLGDIVVSLELLNHCTSPFS